MCVRVDVCEVGGSVGDWCSLWRMEGGRMCEGGCVGGRTCEEGSV